MADCLGLATLLAGKRAAGSTPWFWLAQPWIWAGFFFFLFIWSGAIQLSREFIIITGSGLVLVAGGKRVCLAAQISSGMLWLAPIVGASLLLLTNINYDASDNFRQLTCSSLTWPRYFLGEFVVATALLAAALLYRHWLPRSSLIWLDVVNLLLIALALADLRLTQIMGRTAGLARHRIWRRSKNGNPAGAALSTRNHHGPDCCHLPLRRGGGPVAACGCQKAAGSGGWGTVLAGGFSVAGTGWQLGFSRRQGRRRLRPAAGGNQPVVQPRHPSGHG